MSDKRPDEPTAEQLATNSVQVLRPSAIVLRADQDEFDHKQLSTLALLSPGLSAAPRGHLAMFFHYCVRTGLDPFARQIYMIGRTNWKAADNADEPEKTWTIQTGIDGFRTVAHRAAARASESISYEDTVYYDSEGNAHDVWLSKAYPAAVKVTVVRGSGRFPFIARWDEFAPTYYDRRQSAYVVAKMWQQMPAHMLRKCAEAGSLRMAAPQDLSGVYADEEMERADAELAAGAAADATRRLRDAAGLEPAQTSEPSADGEPASPVTAAGPAEPAPAPKKRAARPGKATPATGGVSLDKPEPSKRAPRKRTAARPAA